jgi:hypothetical protein
MRYLDFITDNFLIDDQETGKLVPFMPRPVQQKYYSILCEEYDIERRGISIPIREDILKARKEGFTSLILGLFAADDILNENPTEGELISYKDDATKQFRKRYRTFILSYFAQKAGVSAGQIQTNINILEKFAKSVFAIDSNSGEYKLRHNGARFYCGTASAKTGERGGTLHKLLFSEHAHYPDTPNMSAKEIVVGTTEQVNFSSGWVFKESTANGMGNFHHDEWWNAYRGKSRFKGRFFGWRDCYTPEQFKIIASQFSDKSMLRQEYPETPEEAFIASGSPYFDQERLLALLKNTLKPVWVGNVYGDPNEIRLAAIKNNTGLTGIPREVLKGLITFTEAENGNVKIYEWPDEYSWYVGGADTAEGLPHGDDSVLRIFRNSNMKLAAKIVGQISPDEFAKLCFLLGVWYNRAYLAVEVNKDGLWVNRELVKWNYPNIYFQEILDRSTQKSTKRFGWDTNETTRPVMLAELQKTVSEKDDIWDKRLLRQCLTFVKNKVGRPEAASGKKDDEIFAAAIGLMVRHNVPVFVKEPPAALTSYEDMRKKEIHETIKRVQSGEMGQEFREDYTNL